MELRGFLERLAREAGEMAMDYRSQLASLAVDFKTERDLVTEADTAIESFLVESILAEYPDHAIKGEETGEVAGSSVRWIIDPIDGTAAFVHNQPFFSISIAVEKKGKLALGAVCAPALGELYLAERGKGAFCNGRRLQASKTDRLDQAMMATGFACLRAGLEKNNLPIFTALVPQLRDVRRYGSAAIDLCYVAAGRLEGFWELNLNIYDVAAGFLMVQEAGGTYSDFSGGKENLYDEILASNGLLHPDLLAFFKKMK